MVCLVRADKSLSKWIALVPTRNENGIKFGSTDCKDAVMGWKLLYF